MICTLQRPYLESTARKFRSKRSLILPFVKPNMASCVSVSTKIPRVEFLFLIGRDNFLVSKPLSPEKTSLEPWRFSCRFPGIFSVVFEWKRFALRRIPGKHLSEMYVKSTTDGLEKQFMKSWLNGLVALDSVMFLRLRPISIPKPPIFTPGT